MQHRYVGDIGDYFKFGLLRALANGKQLGIVWYLYPDEDHNKDGRHTSYLEDAAKWAGFDPKLYDSLKQIVDNDERSLEAVEHARILGDAQYASTKLEVENVSVSKKRDWRENWFRIVQQQLNGCNVIFADPDNGLCPDDRFSHGRTKDWKRIPFHEVMALAEGRTAVIYHHNTRFKGGHHAEVHYWLDQMPTESIAIRVKPYSPRTFFIVNPTPEITLAAKQFVSTWSPHAEYIPQSKGLNCNNPTWQDIIEAVENFREHFDPGKLPQFCAEGPTTLDTIWADNLSWPCASYVGIYCILGANQELLYIGKASAMSSIGKRLSTYFKNNPSDKRKWITSKGHQWPEDRVAPHSVATIGIEKITNGSQPPNWAWLSPSLEEYLITQLSPPANTMQIVQMNE